MEAVRHVTDEQGQEAIQMSLSHYEALYEHHRRLADLEEALRDVVSAMHVLKREDYERLLAFYEDQIRSGSPTPEEAKANLDVLEEFEAEAALSRALAQEEAGELIFEPFEQQDIETRDNFK